MNPPASVVYSFVQAYECVINELCRHALNEVLPKRFFFFFSCFTTVNTQAMDHEEQTTRKMLVSVENELPYFLCKVKTRTPLHLWDVESNTSVPVLVKPFPVTITVDDVNDPPEFVPPVKIRLITENAKIGTLLETFTVIDPDKTHGNSFQ